MKRNRFAAIATLFLAVSASASEPNMTSVDRKLTKVTWLKNGIPVIARETPGSDIAHLEVRYLTGTSNQSPDRRAINLLAFEVMPYATKKFSKEKIFALTEKYSIGVACSGGVEVSGCKVEAIQEYLPQAIDLLLSVVTEPSFTAADVDLAKKQRIANFQQEAQSPESRVNSVVNTIFYDVNHPYRLLPEDGTKQTEALTAEYLKSYHLTTLDASTMFVTYAGPKITKKTLDALEAQLGE